jgi:hypothetical protein
MTTSLSSNGNATVAKPMQRYNSSVSQIVDLNKPLRDPAKRKGMKNYQPNQRDDTRKEKIFNLGTNQLRF